MLKRLVSLLALPALALAQEPLERRADGGVLLSPAAGVVLALDAADLGERLSARPPYLGQTLRVGVAGSLPNLLEALEPAWEALSGADLELVALPLERLSEAEGFEEQLDGLVAPGWLIGELVLGAGPGALPLETFLESPALPPTPSARLLNWDGAPYGVALEADSLLLYWREDILADPEWRARYEAETGVPPPNPPTTWEEVEALAQFYNGLNWDEADAEPDHGLALPLGEPFTALEQFLAVSGPYLVAAGEAVTPCNAYFFNPTTLAPLVNSEGHLRGLERFSALAATGPSPPPSFDARAAEDLFLRGKALMTVAPGALGERAENPARSLVAGRWRSSRLPGSLSRWDACEGRWLQTDAPNRIGNRLGPDASGFVFAGPDQEAVYSLFALLSSDALRDLERTLAGGFGPADAEAPGAESRSTGPNAGYLGAIEASRSDPSQLPDLRLPGSVRYRLALAEEVRESLLGRLSPHEALDRAALRWGEISEELDSAAQLAAYRASLGLEPLSAP